MKEFSIVMIGAPRSGKTVFLACMFEKLYMQDKFGSRRFYLTVEDRDHKKHLNNIYEQIANPNQLSWPDRSTLDTFFKVTFICNVRVKNKPIEACRFTYVDYAGEHLTEVSGELSDSQRSAQRELFREIEQADILLMLLDGQKILSLMENGQESSQWVHRDLKNMLKEVHDHKHGVPIHIVVSKWDILRGKFSRKDIKERLLKISHFKKFIDNFGDVPLIPVSSIGYDFATLLEGEMVKLPGSTLDPYNVEVPLACVIPDVVHSHLKKLQQERLGNSARLDKFLKYLEDSAYKLYDSWSKKHEFSATIVKLVAEVIFRPGECNAPTDAELDKSLSLVVDEETALDHLVRCCLAIQGRAFGNSNGTGL